MTNELIKYSLMFKALSDENRLKIVELLYEEGELCGCKLLENFNITQPTFSYHMKYLTESGMVIAKKKGSWIYYTLNKDNFSKLIKYLKYKCKEELIYEKS